MRLILDAQLPRRLCDVLTSRGHDCLHTLNLPEGNRTSDAALVAFADSDHRILVTKDSDFVEARLRFGHPARLLLVSTGNIDNSALIAIFEAYLGELEHSLEEPAFAELTRSLLIIH